MGARSISCSVSLILLSACLVGQCAALDGLASLGKEGQGVEGLNKLLAWSIGEAFEATSEQTLVSTVVVLFLKARRRGVFLRFVSDSRFSVFAIQKYGICSDIFIIVHCICASTRIASDTDRRPRSLAFRRVETLCR